MKKTGLGLLMVVLVGLPFTVLFLLTGGCEVSGSYHGDNTAIQFSNTNAATSD